METEEFENPIFSPFVMQFIEDSFNKVVISSDMGSHIRDNDDSPKFKVGIRVLTSEPSSHPNNSMDSFWFLSLTRTLATERNIIQ